MTVSAREGQTQGTGDLASARPWARAIVPGDSETRRYSIAKGKEVKYKTSIQQTAVANWRPGPHFNWGDNLNFKLRCSQTLFSWGGNFPPQTKTSVNMVGGWRLPWNINKRLKGGQPFPKGRTHMWPFSGLRRVTTNHSSVCYVANIVTIIFFLHYYYSLPCIITSKY